MYVTTPAVVMLKNMSYIFEAIKQSTDFLKVKLFSLFSNLETHTSLKIEVPLIELQTSSLD